MQLLLRTVKHSRWLKEPAAPFLADDDVPADPFADLLTKQNMLSVWEVSENRSNIERIVRAVAIGKQEIAHSGYIIFDSALLTRAGIEIRNNKGASLDEGANGWHRDLVLSGSKLLALAKLMFQFGEPGIVLKARLRELVESGIRDGELPDKLPVRL